MKNKKDISALNNVAILTNLMMNARKLIKKAIYLIPSDTDDEVMKKILGDLKTISKLLKEDINIAYNNVTSLISAKRKESSNNE